MRFIQLTICMAITLLPLVAFAENNSVARIDNAAQIDEIVQHYQAQCDEAQATVPREIDADFSVPPPKGVLTLDPKNVYSIEITPPGKRATVLYPSFHCSNIGYAWCGTGGCGFFLIVDGVIYHRASGFDPTSVTFHADDSEETVGLFVIHGTGCKSATGRDGAGVDPCYVTFVWDEVRQTFFSEEGSVQVWEAD